MVFFVPSSAFAVGISPSEVIVDDLLATGGTAEAVIHLVKELGGTVAGLAFLIELQFLKGREKLKGYDIYTMIQY